MNKKMSTTQIVRWIAMAFEEIRFYLELYDIPYTECEPKIYERTDTLYADNKKVLVDDEINLDYLTLQFRFPWYEEGDVVIGTLHVDDDLAIDCMIELWDHAYPSIETYGFPWDNGDITVFRSPAEFARVLIQYYRAIQEGKTDKWFLNQFGDEIP